MADIAESLIAAQQKLDNAEQQLLAKDYIAIVESCIAMHRHVDQMELWAWRQIRAAKE